MKSNEKRSPVILTIILFLVFFSPISSRAAQGDLQSPATLSLESLKPIPILGVGRIKPLDTYAQNLLLQFSGKRSFNRRPSIDWLAKLLFTPETTLEDKVFLTNSPEIPAALGIIPDPKRRYSFTQLEQSYHKLDELATAASQIEEKKRTIVENEFVRIFENLQLYLKLSQSLQFIFPHPDFKVTNVAVKEHLQLPSDQVEFSFLDMVLQAEALQSLTDAMQQKGADTWTSFEKEIFLLVTNLYHWSAHYRDMVLAIIPYFGGTKEEWLSPWDAIVLGFQQDEIKREIVLLRDLGVAYRQGKQARFDIAAHAFLDSVEKRAGNLRPLRYLSLEVFYNKSNLFMIAQLFYGMALLIVIVSFFTSKRIWHTASFITIIFGFIPHAIALISRIVIMGRPPVTSFYETFIFVGAITVFLGIIVELIHKKWLGIMVSSICGTILLILATKFSTDGDTLKMLVAVLNSNFWLSIHVPNITMGYSACCVAGILGHIYIFQAILKPKDKKQLEATYKIVLGVLGLGLTLAFFGTTLGGIWADQSWGRFWGWDPKENGALMIVLWCAIIFHAKIARLIGPLGVAAASAFLLTVVTWAWFGVNLLSVGLHSYGFTSGIATGLIIFVASELIFLTVAVPVARNKLRKNP